MKQHTNWYRIVSSKQLPNAAAAMVSGVSASACGCQQHGEWPHLCRQGIGYGRMEKMLVLNVDVDTRYRY